MLPATALAATPNGQVIYVGNENVTSGGYWTTDSDGNVTASTVGDTPTDNYISYDAENNVLTLHNATIKNELEYNASIEGGTLINDSAIGVFNPSGNAKLTINLEGTNTIAKRRQRDFCIGQLRFYRQLQPDHPGRRQSECQRQSDRHLGSEQR